MEFKIQHKSSDDFFTAQPRIDFHEFGVPLKDLKKSSQKDVPQILVDILCYINSFKTRKPYFPPREKLKLQNFETENLGDDINSFEMILLQFLKQLPQPLIAIEVTQILMKIQEKYGAEHPFLCNSRFRHTLHQLPRPAHAVLHHLCHFLHTLCRPGEAGPDSDNSDCEAGPAAHPATCLHLGTVFVDYVFGIGWQVDGAGEPLRGEAMKERRSLLARIVSELISEYRAIFEIESTLEAALQEEEGGNTSNEPRKRHEEDEEECPEDIKAMKVAWDELSLECSATREDSPAKLGRSSRLPETRNRLDLVKTFTNNNNNNSMTRSVCLAGGRGPVSLPCERPDCCGMAGHSACPRKRKDRQDSTSEADRKFSRSSSLEVAATVKQSSGTGERPARLRSASPQCEPGAGAGTGDHVLQQLQESDPTLPKKPAVEEKEMWVALSRARRRPAGRRGRKERCDSLKENQKSSPTVAASVKSGQETEEAVAGADCDYKRRFSSGGEEGGGCWVSQHLQHMISVDTAKETLSMINQHPRNFNIFNSERHIEHNRHLVERRLSEPASPKKAKQKQLTRQLSSVKKKIEQLEQAFTQRTGYRPSQADKLNDSELKNMLSEQARLKKELKTSKEGGEGGGTAVRHNKCLAAMRDSLLKIELRLEQSRVDRQRPASLDRMTLDQILDEKLAMQRLLLEFEAEHGHPQSRQEKEAMKDLYERYRAVKRAARRSASVRGEAGELPAIPEEEAVALTLASPGHRIVLSLGSGGSSHHWSATVDREECDTVSKHDMDLPDIEHSNKEDEHWHSLPRCELLEIQKRVREDKKQLRRSVKEFEDTFKTQTGRMLLKDDKEPFEKTYQQYKTTKAKLKLIDALLSKQ